ncbi:MAG TPA: ROK family protein [Verrucomicrobiae bacterium]|nr:ROK family protein [Verrucomicrobiae bacterium]
MNIASAPRIIPPLDSQFHPPILEKNCCFDAVGKPTAIVIGLERENGLISRHETVVDGDRQPDASRELERIVKFLLWARGGWKLYLGGPDSLVEPIQVPHFDADLMERVYEHPFEVVLMDAPDVPSTNEKGAVFGGHLDGCRIGFDLGASDYKVAAVEDGTVVYSQEFPWNPRDQSDPRYHYEHLHSGLKKAAQHLARVDAIGGSTAGIVVNNRIMASSLFRGVPADELQRTKDIFLNLRREWGVPLEVVNDGDVTALAGAMSLGESGILGIAMGSSEAAGFCDRQGRLLGWLNELAFAPVDRSREAPLDEWSGGRGVGAQYFSQQAVNRLLVPAGIDLPRQMEAPERLQYVQKLMVQEDPRAAKIYETIGVYLGYTIPHYARFYDFGHVLVLGRVTTGTGGNIILAKAREVLQTEFQELAEGIVLHLPDEKSRRVGQAVAAASLPMRTQPKASHEAA